MALEVGSRLGHYDVTALIGECGGRSVRSREEKALAKLGRELDPAELEQTADMLCRIRELFEGDRFRQSLGKRGKSRH